MPNTSELVENLIDPARPVFLFGSTPPLEGTTDEKVREMADGAVRQSSKKPGMEVLKQGFLEKKGGSTVCTLLRPLFLRS